MKLIQKIAKFANAYIVDSSELRFSQFNLNYELSLHTLTHYATLSVSFDHGHAYKLLPDNVVLEIANLMSQANIQNVYVNCDIESNTIAGHVTFNYRDYSELTYFLTNAVHALAIANRVYAHTVDKYFDHKTLCFDEILEEGQNALLEHLSEHLAVRILYVHGFRSSGESSTAQRLRELLPHCSVFSPDLPTDAAAALQLLRHIIRAEKIDVVIGTSMGGMLAQKLRGVPKVLINPSFHVSKTFRKNIGTVSYFSARADGTMQFEITPKIVSSYEDLERIQFVGLTPRELDITVGIFGTEDDVVNCADQYLRHYDSIAYFRFGHRLNPEALKYAVIPAIAKVYRASKMTN